MIKTKNRSSKIRYIIGIICIIWWSAIAFYWIERGEPEHLLFLCDITLLITGAGLLLGSSFLLTSQFIGSFVIQSVWNIDLVCRLIFGFHPVKATTYMFSPSHPLTLKLLSTFHILLPFILLYSLIRFGYHKKGLILQGTITIIVMIMSYMTTTIEGNTNWVLGPFHQPQKFFHPLVYLSILTVLIVILYLVTDLVLRTISIINQDSRK